MTGVKRTNEGAWSALMQSALEPAYGVAFYESAASIGLDSDGQDSHAGVHPLTGDFYLNFTQAADDITLLRLSVSAPEAEGIVTDDTGVAGSESDIGRVCVTANGSVFYEDRGGSVPQIKYVDSAGTLQWGHAINSNLGSEVLLDLLAFADPNTGNDRLFVFMTQLTTDEVAVYEVDISSPGSNAVGSRFNVQWQNNKQPVSGSTSMIYDPFNHKIVVGGSSIGYTGSSDFTVLVFDPDDTTTAALELQIRFTSVAYDNSPSDDEHYTLAYDSKNNEYVSMVNTAGSLRVHRLSPTDLTINSDRYFTGFSPSCAGGVIDDAGNIYLWNHNNNEIVCIDDTFTVQWQYDLTVSGVTAGDLRGIQVSGNSLLAIVHLNDSSYDWVSALVMPKTGLAFEFTFTGPNAATSTVGFTSMIADEWYALGDATATANITANQTEFSTLNMDTGTNNNTEVGSPTYNLEVSL